MITCASISSDRYLQIPAVGIDRCVQIAVAADPIQCNDGLPKAAVIHDCSQSHQLPAVIIAGCNLPLAVAAFVITLANGALSMSVAKFYNYAEY